MRIFLSFTLFGIAIVSFFAFQNFSSVPQPDSSQKNVVFILTDDMRYDDVAHLEKLKALMKKRGKTFKRFFATTSICCPSRATILRGQLAHNHGVVTNGYSPVERKRGGFYRFKELNNEASTYSYVVCVKWVRDWVHWKIFESI